MPGERIVIGHCTVDLVQGDITKIAVDAIVNAANSMLAGGGGVDGAIHAAGGPELMRELQRYDGCPTGHAVVTPAGRLPAKFVFHAVGPVYRGGRYGEAEQLASCYRTALELANEHRCESISFPSISTGIYGYPLADAAAVALGSISETLLRLDGTVREVKLVQFNAASYDVYRSAFLQFPTLHVAQQTS